MINHFDDKASLDRVPLSVSGGWVLWGGGLLTLDLEALLLYWPRNNIVLIVLMEFRTRGTGIDALIDPTSSIILVLRST